MTILELLKKYRPDVIKRMDEQGCWNYFGPSLEDEAQIRLRIQYGNYEKTGEEIVSLKIIEVQCEEHRL